MRVQLVAESISKNQLINSSEYSGKNYHNLGDNCNFSSTETASHEQLSQGTVVSYKKHEKGMAAKKFLVTPAWSGNKAGWTHGI